MLWKVMLSYVKVKVRVCMCLVASLREDSCASVITG